MRPGNPYLRAWRRRIGHQWRVEGIWAFLPAIAGPILATALLVPLARPVFLGFLEAGPSAWGPGIDAVTVRAVLVLAGWAALDAHQAVLRAGDRAFLAGLPVDPAKVVRYELARLAVSRAWMVPCAAAILAPIAAAGLVLPWLAAVAVLAETWVLSGVVAAGVALLAIGVAESPQAAGLLDLVRGRNPREQAAFLWAPGVVLAVVGAVVLRTTEGAIAWSQGDASGAGWLVVPPLASIGAWAWLPRLAERSWFRGTAVLTDIDARYAALGERQEASTVYLDWAVRFLPAGWRSWALLDLRHGWRGRRSWISGAWLAGIAAFAAGWSASADAVVRAAVVGAIGAWACGAVSPWMDRDEPAFTRIWIPDDGLGRLAARVAVVAAWLQPIAGLAAISLMIRQGLGAALACLGAVEVSAIGAGLLGATCRRTRLGIPAYAPAAAVLAGVASTASAWLGRSS